MTRRPDSATVLVVDDEPAVRKLTRRILEGAGYQVHDASDGLEALGVLDEHGPFDLVISDIRMPNMDGRALAIYLRSLTPPVPILLMSGYDDLLSDRPFLAKPFRPDQLLARVQETLDSFSSKQA